MPRRRTPDPDVHVVTSAAVPLSQDQAGRTRRYLFAMGIRTACVLLAIIVPGWPRWLFITAAIVLPYLAVVVANAGRENTDPTPITSPGAPRIPELPASNT